MGLLGIQFVANSLELRHPTDPPLRSIHHHALASIELFNSPDVIGVRSASREEREDEYCRSEPDPLRPIV